MYAENDVEKKQQIYNFTLTLKLSFKNEEDSTWTRHLTNKKVL